MEQSMSSIISKIDLVKFDEDLYKPNYKLQMVY